MLRGGPANRREILRLLSEGDKPVREIAAALGSDYPAVPGWPGRPTGSRSAPPTRRSRPRRARSRPGDDHRITPSEAGTACATAIRGVFAELAQRNPDGLQYAAFRLADGVSFLHVAVLDNEENPLTVSPAFGEFQSGVQARCAEGPIPADAAVVGSYRLLAE